jgi:hypothetical protein
LPYQQLQGINPILAQQHPLLAQLAQTGALQQIGQSLFGQNPIQGQVNPQHLVASLIANNPVLAGALLSHPLVAATLYAHAQSQQNPQFGLQQQPQLFPQIGQQIPQMGSPFGQQTGYPLAPQSWIGQGAQFGGQAFGQRPFQPQGFSPWGY